MEEKIITKGETHYKLRLFPTMQGLQIQRKLATMDDSGPEPTLFFEVIQAGCYINNIAISEKKFNEHFRGKYQELLEVFYAILAYNFGNSEDPNVESGTED